MEILRRSQAWSNFGYSFFTQAVNSLRWSSVTPCTGVLALTQSCIEAFSTAATVGEDFSSDA